jgi:MoaA/NifB/PqqE/SkfB family radical SAM enzyme
MRNGSSARSGNEVREAGLWENIRERLLGRRRALDWIQVEVTSRCPGRCTYCPHTTMCAGCRRFRARLAGGDPNFPCKTCPKRFSP